MEDQPLFDEAFARCLAWWTLEGKSDRVHWMFQNRMATYKLTTWFLANSSDDDRLQHARYYEAARAERLNIEFHHYGEHNGVSLVGVEVPGRILLQKDRSYRACLNFKIALEQKRKFRPVRSMFFLMAIKIVSKLLHRGRLFPGEALPRKVN